MLPFNFRRLVARARRRVSDYIQQRRLASRFFSSKRRLAATTIICCLGYRRTVMFLPERESTNVETFEFRNSVPVSDFETPFFFDVQ